MGEEIDYSCVGECECTSCGNTINAKLHFYEYPVGAINDIQEPSVIDSLQTGATVVEKPTVYIYMICKNGGARFGY